MTYKRKEIIGDCTLLLGDCLEVLRQRNWMGGKRVSYPVEQAA